MFIKESYIKQIGPKKFRVYSEKGRNMGTYNSMVRAKERLKKIEYFKHQNSSDDNHVFPRGGQGDVPQFFRKNLDYGERSKVLKKKLSKLKAVKAALQGFGLRKEAAAIKRSIKSILLGAFLGLSLIGGIAYNLGGKEILQDKIADFSLEESPNLIKLKKEFPIGTQTDTIINEIYPDIQVEDKKDIIFEFLKEYNSNLIFSESGLQLKQTELFPHTERAQVAYPDLKEIMAKFARRIGKEYFVDEVGTVGGMDMSDIAISSLKTDEGYKKNVYNDDKSLRWPRDMGKTSAGWTIGYGHKLTPEELSSGVIALKNGRKIKWKKGIDEEDANRIKVDDIIRHTIDEVGVNNDTPITRAMYDSLTRLSFNFGRKNLRQFISSIKDESGNLSSDLFAKEISGWTGVDQPENKKGIIIDRIGSLLAARGILLPDDPTHIDIEQDTISPNSVMKYPDKEMIQKYIVHLTGTRIKELTPEDVKPILNALSKEDPPPSTPSEAFKIMKESIN